MNRLVWPEIHDATATAESHALTDPRTACFWALRGMEMRDMVAISILLAGFTPYLTDLVDSEMVYGA